MLELRRIALSLMLWYDQGLCYSAPGIDGADNRPRRGEGRTGLARCRDAEIDG